ncbi:hypothetical protein WAJ71_21240, partial [Acinetobacter baumannii]
YALLFGVVERKLFAQLCAGASATRLKPAFCLQYGLTARQFNSVQKMLEGKIAAVRASIPKQLEELEWRIARAQKVIRKLERRAPR